MIDLTSATKTIGHRTLWENITTTFRAGTLTAITGPSGCGKTTLLNCIGTLEKLTHGRILLDGRDITHLRPRAAARIRRQSIGYLFQDFALIDTATVAANLRLVTSRHSNTIPRALTAVGLEGFEHRTVAELSGGEQQRVAMARILTKRPPIVLCDEPTAALDHDNAHTLGNLLTTLAADGACVIIATHDLQLAARATHHLHLGT